MAFATDNEIHRHTDCAGIQGSNGCTCVSANQTLDNNHNQNNNARTETENVLAVRQNSG